MSCCVCVCLPKGCCTSSENDKAEQAKAEGCCTPKDTKSDGGCCAPGSGCC